eukprot:scaffold867_cov229-Pinguiococcus_pyrenoidosus.AAC.1
MKEREEILFKVVDGRLFWICHRNMLSSGPVGRGIGTKRRLISYGSTQRIFLATFQTTFQTAS